MVELWVPKPSIVCDIIALALLINEDSEPLRSLQLEYNMPIPVALLQLPTFLALALGAPNCGVSVAPRLGASPSTPKSVVAPLARQNLGFLCYAIQLSAATPLGVYWVVLMPHWFSIPLGLSLRMSLLALCLLGCTWLSLHLFNSLFQPPQ